MSRTRLRAIVLACLLAAPGAGAAQDAPAVFTPLPAAARSAPAEAAARALAARQDLPVAARQYAGMRLDRVFAGAAGASRLALNLFGQVLPADRVRVDMDASGHRSWVGVVAGEPDSHVVLTERAGVVSGVIDTAAATYQVRTVSDGLYALELVDRTALGAELPPLEPPAAPGAAPARTAARPEAAADSGATIDILLLYTPAMRAAAGGTAQVAALASQVISDTNTAYQQSGIGTLVRLVGSFEVPITESTSSMSSDLLAVTNSATAAAYRNQVGADLVQLLVHSPSTSACGVGWLMTPGLFGSQFAPNAYSVADWRCASQYTPTHEMGHNEGSHHAPEDGASGALFSYSYGYKSPGGTFRSVMAYSCGVGAGCPRVLRFSNPSVAYLGEVTGTASQNNALSISQAASTVANFRQAVTTSPSPTPTPTPGATPAAPTGLQSVVNGSAVTLSWNAVSDPAAPATAYRIEVGSAPGALDLANQNVGGATSVSGQVGLGLYYWRVYGVNAAGQGPASTEAQFAVVSGGGCSAAPSPPQNFSYARAGNVVTLQWLAPAAGVPTTYVVEAGSASGLANLYNQAVGATLGLQVQAPPGTYFVRVRAANACGTSGPSNEAIITVP
ncbi:MAG: reprolysin-like metallopeptidase [Vicinamibacterales bacterium]